MAILQREYSFTDESFDVALSQSYYMSIRFSPDGLSFCTLDPVRNQYIQFKHVPVKGDGKDFTVLSEIVNAEPLFKLDFQKVVIMVDNHLSVLVPSMLHRPESNMQMLSFAFHDQLDGFVAMENRIKMADAVNVYAVPRHLVELVERVFGDVHFMHSTTPLLESNMFHHQTHEGAAKIGVHIENDSFYITVIEHRRLALFNRFELKVPNDLVYFVMFVVDQCRLSANELEIITSGPCAVDSAGVKLLKGYFKKVRPVRIENQQLVSPALRDVDYPTHFQLLNFGACV
jgi:hypothetical protein